MPKLEKKAIDKFVKDNYITCECGYNNEKHRFENYGTCLRCGRVLDPKKYLMKLLKIKNRSFRNGRKKCLVYNRTQQQSMDSVEKRGE